MTRNASINRGILGILERCEPYALPEKQLRNELNAALRPPVGDAEFDESMEFLNRRTAIATVPDGLDPNLVKWTITETGKALLRQ